MINCGNYAMYFLNKLKNMKKKKHYYQFFSYYWEYSGNEIEECNVEASFHEIFFPEGTAIRNPRSETALYEV